MFSNSQHTSVRRVSLLLGCAWAIAQTEPYINSVAEYNTECKTCPWSLCSNELYYSWNDEFNATCWTKGGEIIGDNLWLKSEAGCYVTQYDMIEYEGDYTEDLAHCGKESEQLGLTTEDATLQYKTECRICPELKCDVVEYMPEDTDLILTCWTENGQVVIDDPYWLKTTKNCYVARKGLYKEPDMIYLDNCGPIPFLEIGTHQNDSGSSLTTNEEEQEMQKRTPLPKRSQLGTQYLINVTVGEEYASCRSCPEESCEVEKWYEFNDEVWLQCLVNANGTWWSETTNFCYMKNSDFWESPEGDYYRNPLCEYFEESGDE